MRLVQIRHNETPLVGGSSPKQQPSDSFQTRAQKRDAVLRIKEAANHLAAIVVDGPFDLLIYEFFPDDVTTKIFTQTEWPSLTDILVILAHRANKHAQGCMTEKRFIERDTQDREFNHFVRHLKDELSEYFGPSPNYILAHIAEAVFRKPISAEMVKLALGPSRLKRKEYNAP